MKKIKKPAKLKRLIIGVIEASFTLVFSLALILDMYFADITPTFESCETVLEAVDNKEIYAIFRYNSDTVWYVYNKDLDPDADLSVPVTSRFGMLCLTDDKKWHSANLIVTEDIYNRICNAGVGYYTSINFDPFVSRILMYLSTDITLILPVALLIFLYIYYSKVGMTGGNAVTASGEAASSVHFTDVIGQDEVIDDLNQYITILKNSESLKAQKIKQPKGLLFTGPPGTGKTLIAKALAGEAKVPFLYANSSSMINKFVGVGASNIRKLFKQARQCAPCILFLDELDAIGGTRGAQSVRSSEDNQTLLALLQEMDGFASVNGVLIIGATNCPETLDVALCRAGRFDREIKINPPRNRAVRKQLFEHYTKSYTLANDVDLTSLAGQTHGLTGADIAFICNEAAVIAAARDSSNVILESDDFIQALDKFMLKGNRSKIAISEHDKIVTAYHEAGHAVMAYLSGETISRVTIQSMTSGVGGYVMREESDQMLQTKEQLIHQILICYAGRCSEEIKFGKDKITTGASSDIKMATKHIIDLLASFGYDDSFGLLDYSTLTEARLSDGTKMTNRASELARECYDKCRQTLSNNYAMVTRIAEKLLAVNDLSGDEVKQLLVIKE